jgi:hypothetical protein
MAIEAPVSKFSRTNLKIYIVVCIAATIWLGYDGYFNKKFIEEHSPDGKPNGTLIFNQKAPPVFIAVAVLLGIKLYLIRNKKLIADEKDLIFSDKEKIAYDSIEEIDRTHFRPASKTKRQFVGDSEGEIQETETDSDWRGYFIIRYKDKNNRLVSRKLSDRQYDNLKAILDHLVAEIT